MNCMSRKAFVLTITVLVALAVAATALAVSAGKPQYQKDQEQVSNLIADQLTKAVPYPISQMLDSLERRNLRERLIRFNKPNKIGYLYVMSFGKFVGYYVVKGKVTSTQSQMSNPDQSFGCGDHCEFSVKSISDDGSWGPNEGGDKGVFFFTPSGVMVETTLDWVYSDAPLTIDVPNLIGKK